MIFEIRCRNYFVLLIALWNCWIKVQFYFITFDNLKMFKWYHQLQDKMFCSGIINKSSLVKEKRLVYILVYWSTFPLIDWPRSGMWMVRNWRNGLGRPLQRGMYGPGVPIELIDCNVYDTIFKYRVYCHDKCITDFSCKNIDKDMNVKLHCSFYYLECF